MAVVGSSEHKLLTAALNVGTGCALLRRESQIPIATRSMSAMEKRPTTYHNDSDVTATSKTPWEIMRQRLFEQQVPPDKAVERMHYEECNKELHPIFEQQNRPVVLDGCTSDWTAMESCRFSRLVERFGHLHWRFSDTHAETMTLATYQKYISCIEGLTDDAPLAIYDSQFGYDERSVILDEYDVPACFDTDLFELITPQEENDQQRPPFRWILIGPARSGTGLHIDPVGTHAWVTLVEGCKRWVLFPPDTCASTIHMQHPQIPSVLWFRDRYDQAPRDVPGVVEVLQHPGETVYVPAGWPHLVLNLDLSVAITHNYATEFPSMERLWEAVVEAEPDLASLLLQSLESQRPELAERIDSSSVVKTVEKDDGDDSSDEKKSDGTGGVVPADKSRTWF